MEETQSSSPSSTRRTPPTPSLATSSTATVETPIRADKIACMQNSTVLKQLLSQLEENNKNINKMYPLVKKHEEILSKTCMITKERNKYVPITVRVSDSCMHVAAISCLSIWMQHETRRVYSMLLEDSSFKGWSIGEK